LPQAEIGSRTLLSDQSQFLAGREYQQAHDASVIGSMRSVDLSKTKVIGGPMAEALTDRQRLAAARLRSIEAKALTRYGNVGVCQRSGGRLS
jgi:hypothetical protein